MTRHLPTRYFVLSIVAKTQFVSLDIPINNSLCKANLSLLSVEVRVKYLIT